MACSLTPLLSEPTARLHASAKNALEADHAAATSGCGAAPPCGVPRELPRRGRVPPQARTCLQARTTVSRSTPVPDSNAAFTTAACESWARARRGCEYELEAAHSLACASAHPYEAYGCGCARSHEVLAASRERIQHGGQKLPCSACGLSLPESQKPWRRAAAAGSAGAPVNRAVPR